MNGFGDAEARLDQASSRIEELRPKLDQAVATGEVSGRLKTDVAEVIEHLRAALDYCAYELYQRHGAPTKHGRPPKVYFPIVGAGQDFASILRQKIPGLAKSRPDLARLLETYQVTADPANEWLCDLAMLAVESKHQKLSVQKPHTRRALRVSDGRAGIQVAEGGSVTIENVAFGEHVIKGPEKVDVDHPPRDFTGQVDHVSDVFIGWRLGGRPVAVLAFLLQARNGVRHILQEVARLA